VLVAGGQNTSGYLPNAELFDPATGIWTPTGSLNGARVWHTATLLPNGKVLAAAGYRSAYLNSAELFDPATGSWSTNSPLITSREYQSATLLPNGKVLIVGGNGSTAATNSVELFDVGLNFTAASQPRIASLTSPLSLGSALAISGSGFRGLGGNMSGTPQNSSSDYPVLQLRSLDSERTLFVPPANWTTNSFLSAPVSGFPPGYALATVFVNGIPSTGSVLNVSVPIPTPVTLTGAKKLTNNWFQFSFTNTSGAMFAALAATNPALPSSNWTILGSVPETSPGKFQFTDPQATNNPQRLYRTRTL
jgi:hypothetical protein